jgi:hypothetical protein
VGGKREKAFGILTGGRWGRCDDCGVPALKSRGSGAWNSVGGQYGCGWSVPMQGLGTLCGDNALGRLLSAGERQEAGGQGVTGGGSVVLQWRSRFMWGKKWGGETGSQGDERGSGVDSFCHGRGRGVARGR